MVVVVAAAGCDKLDTNRTVDPYGSFGEIVYREGCQRVAYTGQLAQKAAGQIQTVDVSGALGNAVCVQGAAPPANSPPKLTTIVGQQDDADRDRRRDPAQGLSRHARELPRAAPAAVRRRHHGARHRVAR